MNKQVLDWCGEQNLFRSGDRVLCALSGGTDSVAMVHILKSLQTQLDITLVCGHFNHQLRGAQSDGDELFRR